LTVRECRDTLSFAKALGKEMEAGHMDFDIEDLTYGELVDLNRRIIERLKMLDQIDAHHRMMEFSIGERVTFAPVGREPVTGTICRYNRKTVTVTSDAGDAWRVPPHLLRRATPPGEGGGNVIPIHEGKDKRDR
jgi:hypothetical protein